jgi:oxygen-dependent protoporphyrinogen oxidase
LADEIIDATVCDQPSQVVRHGRLVTTPLSLLSGQIPTARSMLTTSLLSWQGKCRVFAERWMPADTRDDESCKSFFTRRFGVEFYFRLVEPVLTGVYSADPAVLSMKALLPHLRDMEREWGSLTAAFRAKARQARQCAQAPRQPNGAAWTLRRGMNSLTSALAARLPDGAIELGAPVHRILFAVNGGWRIEYGFGKTIDAAAVVLATPAYRAAHILAAVSPDAERMLQHIAYSSLAVITLAYRRADIREPLNTLGFFVPASEPFEIRSASLSSFKYAGRAPDDLLLVRASVGGDHHSSIVGQCDAELIELCGDELSRLLRIAGSAVFSRVQRHIFAVPQYRLGHCELIDAVRRRLADFPTLALAGNAYDGIGVPYCIAGGQQAAEQIHCYLNAHPNHRLGAPVLPYRKTASAEPLHA